MQLSYLIWNGDPEIFSIGSFSLRWYGLLFALGFLLSQQILYYMFGKEGKPKSDIDTLTIYMVVATVLGARLGHVIFYQPELIWENPLAIILPFEFSPFRFTGLQGLASHGGAFGILFALWLYSRKKKPGQNYLQTLDRIVIVVALTGALIRLGNFCNSEIIGKPSDNPASFVFISPVTEALTKKTQGISMVEQVKVSKDETRPHGEHARMPINIDIFFKAGTKEQEARAFLANDVKFYLTREDEFVDEPHGTPLNYNFTESNGSFAARVMTLGIARHPAQLYESVTCVLLFLFLFWMWTIKKQDTPQGRIFGVFLIVLWTLRFLYEYLKEPQVAFENDMALYMGQILSIPLIIAGIFVLIYSYRKPEASGTTER